MSDNISRKAALAYPLSWDHYDKEHGNRHFICGVESYREYIESLPSTDRTGEWKEDETGNGFWICSSCGFVSEASGAWLLYKYCPHCGADMRGDIDERKQMGI